jgi:hypothetical protein
MPGWMRSAHAAHDQQSRFIRVLENGMLVKPGIWLWGGIDRNPEKMANMRCMGKTKSFGTPMYLICVAFD